MFFFSPPEMEEAKREGHVLPIWGIKQRRESLMNKKAFNIYKIVQISNLARVYRIDEWVFKKIYVVQKKLKIFVVIFLMDAG